MEKNFLKNHYINKLRQKIKRWKDITYYGRDEVVEKNIKKIFEDYEKRQSDIITNMLFNKFV